jgi:hypothetical protein
LLIGFHSTPSIICASEAQNDRRARLQKAFMSSDQFDELTECQDLMPDPL